jgi:uncharacterized protein DUF3592
MAWRLAIPHAPRKVTLAQVPGAIRRLATVAAVGVAFAAGAGLGARWLSGRLGAERGFLRRAEEVPGLVNQVKLPPKDQREGATARIDVIYSYARRQLSATGVLARAEDAEGWGHGATVTLLVDPQDPDHPREARFARDRARQLDLLPYGVGLGAALALALFGWELRRTFRADLEPLRRGALVWLTPDGPLPETPRETVFKASYYREDVKYPVRARVRPGRAPVRNGDKLLAAVVPKKPTWVRVIDEDLAKTLGWIAE